MNYQRNDSKKYLRTQELRKWVIVLIELAIIVAFAVAVVIIVQDIGFADECKGPCWVLCSPTSSVNVREHPRTTSEVIGWYDAGDQLTTDWEIQNGFLHVVDLSLERTEGWVSIRYLVFDPPQWMEAAEVTVIADGRVAIRRWIDGPRCSGKSGWAKPDSTLQVFWWSKEWCYTNRGYVQTKYLEVE